MKKYVSILCSAALFAGAVSCSDSRPEQSSGGTSVTAEKLAFNAAGISMADDFAEIVTLSADSGGRVFIFGQLKNDGWSGYVTDGQFSDRESFDFTPKENELVKGAAQLRFGKSAVLTVLDGETFIYVIGSDGAVEKELNCGELITDPDIYAQLYRCGDGFLVMCGGMTMSLSAVSAEGKYLGDISTGGLSLWGVYTDSEGGAVCLLNDNVKLCLADIDFDGLTVSRGATVTGPSSSALAMCPGGEQYKAVGVFTDGIYAFTEDSCYLLADFMDMPFTPYDVHNIIMTGENELAVSLWGTSGGGMYLLSERDISELAAKTVVTISTFRELNGIDELSVLIKKFNAEHEDIRIEPKTYVDLSEESFDQLKLDMISGNAPDIIEFIEPIDSFGAKDSIFADMYPLIDSDPDLSREDFLPNVLAGLERNGKLVQIASGFGFWCLPAKSGYPGVRENWSVDDFIAAYEALPEGMDFFYDQEYEPRSLYFNQIVKTPLFVDYENAECSFDSPEFIKLLNFFNDNNIGLTWSQYTQTFESAPQHDYAWDVRNNKTLISTVFDRMPRMGDVFNTVNGAFDGDVTFVGYPTDGKHSGRFITFNSGFGPYGIMANSPHIEEAWRFLKMFVSDYYYDEVNNLPCSPVIADRFDESCEELLHDFTYYDEELGRDVTQKWQFYSPMTGETVDIDHFTEEELEYYKNMVLTAEPVWFDSTIEGIVREETMPFFDLERSAEETAALIQNRVSLYLSEHYQK